MLSSMAQGSSNCTGPGLSRGKGSRERREGTSGTRHSFPRSSGARGISTFVANVGG